jgi:hypothetical protein
MHKLMRLVGAGVVSAAVLAAVPAVAAAGASATVQPQSQAKLQPDGSALVTITYSCFPGLGLGASGTMAVDLEQLNTAGFAGTAVTCDDRSHTITLDVAPGPFTKGEASLYVDLTASNADAQAQVEINIG